MMKKCKNLSKICHFVVFTTLFKTLKKKKNKKVIFVEKSGKIDKLDNFMKKRRSNGTHIVDI